MPDRITPEDADLIAQRIVARFAKVLVAICATIVVLWVVVIGALYVFRAGTGTDSLLFSLIAIAFAAIGILALARFWSKVLR
jgi:hypothetical protein